MAAGLTKNEMEWAREAGIAWYRSKEPTYNAFGVGYLSNKKWPLNEANTIFMYHTVWSFNFIGILCMESKVTPAHKPEHSKL